MPFQDFDEDSSSELPRAPSGLNRVLHRIFIEDWNLKLLSLAITLVLWFIVTGQNTPVNTHASVQLKFIRPSTLEISNDPPKSVDVLLTGSKYRLDDLNKTALVATIDITDQRAGERVLRLADSRTQLDLPQGVTVEAFQPSVISIRLEPIVQRQLGIHATFDGKVAEGFEVYGFRPNKETVSVVGPESKVNALEWAKTETISVAGRRETFTAPNVAIDISDPKIDLSDPVLSIEIEIGPRRIDKTISGVPVSTDSGGATLPSTATVVVYGSPNLLNDVSSGDLKLRIPPSGDVSGASLDLPTALQGKLVLKSVTPSKFTIR